MSIAHSRKRHCIDLLRQKINFAPVVSIQGARQVGKSYLANQILPSLIKDSVYVTLDEKDQRKFADENPNSFLKQHKTKHLIIDEVQKSPDLFDEIKSIVDKNRVPGQFIILGSTEFSHETQIQESLTGRMTRLKLYPLSVSETKKIDFNPQKKFPFIGLKTRIKREDLLLYLSNGGLPGIFSVRSINERKSLMHDWVRLTVERDLHQIKKYKLDSKLALQILECIARLNRPMLSEIVNELGVNSKKIQNHLNALKTLFVIFEVSPFKKSAGKTMYYLTDTGLLNYLDANFEKKLTTWFYLELKSQLSYKDLEEIELYYYKSAASSIVHAMAQYKNELFVIKLGFQQTFDQRDSLIFETIKKRYQDSYKHIHFYILNGGENYFKAGNIHIGPWESIV
jgi:predicted AAA+ superfamily ATPase